VRSDAADAQGGSLDFCSAKKLNAQKVQHRMSGRAQPSLDALRTVVLSVLAHGTHSAAHCSSAVQGYPGGAPPRPLGEHMHAHHYALA